MSLGDLVVLEAVLDGLLQVLVKELLLDLLEVPAVRLHVRNEPSQGPQNRVVQSLVLLQALMQIGRGPLEYPA